MGIATVNLDMALEATIQVIDALLFSLSKDQNSSTELAWVKWPPVRERHIGCGRVESVRERHNGCGRVESVRERHIGCGRVESVGGGTFDVEKVSLKKPVLLGFLF